MSELSKLILSASWVSQLSKSILGAEEGAPNMLDAGPFPLPLASTWGSEPPRLAPVQLVLPPCLGDLVRDLDVDLDIAHTA